MRAPIRPILAPAVLSLAVALVALPTQAQQTPNAAPGIRPEAIYDANGIDNVALMNGALSIRIPLGLSYPVNGGFSYQLMLSYHSTLWENRTDPCADPCQDFVRYEPKITNNAGLGWRLSLGDLIDPASYWNQSQHWTYVEPDGSEHVLYDRLHISDPEDAGDVGQVPALQSVLYSRDGSFVRARRLTSTRWRIEMPDGRSTVFAKAGSTWRVIRLEDAFGNALEVTYTSDAEGPVWELRDGHRTHYVRFTDPSLSYPEAPPLLRSVELSKFGGGTADYVVTYAPKTVNRPGLHNASPIPMEVQVLLKVDLPSQGLYYEMGSETAPAYNGEGLLTQLRLPAAGFLDYEWENLVFPKIRKQPVGPLDEDPEPWRSVWGVKSRKERRGITQSAATWTYEREAHRPDPIGTGPLPERWTVTVTDPNRDYTVHHFSIFPALDGLAIPQWGTKLEEYGLPYTRQLDDASFGTPGAPRYLSSESWDCNNAGNNCQKVRSTYVRYELDDTSPVDDQTGRIFNKNRRVESRRVVYHDDPAGSTPRHRLETYANFDGLGHYRESTVTSDFGPTKQSTTSFNAGVGTYPGSYTAPTKDDPWILGTYESRTVSEGGIASREDFCFDAATGALLRHRVLANRGASPSRSNRDVVRVLDVASNGNMLREDVYGGDAQSVSTGSDLCGLSLPSTPEYRTKHTYQYGSRKTSNAVDPADGDRVVLELADRTIHRGTGLPSRREDMAGYGYGYNFDALGRLVAEKADGNELASIGHEYPPPYDFNSFPRSGYLRTACAAHPGPDGHCNNNYLLLESSYSEVDGLGRLFREARKIPIVGDDEANQGYEIARNGVGC